MGFKNLSFCFLDSITQNSKDLDNPLPLKYVFGNSVLFLNEEGTEFDLENPLPQSEAIAYEPPEAPLQGNAVPREPI
jgi:hypothetical protein